jgi:hypothetical protein
MFMIPVQGYHRDVGPTATMRVKAAALMPVVDVSGNEMIRARLSRCLTTVRDGASDPD